MADDSLEQLWTLMNAHVARAQAMLVAAIEYALGTCDALDTGPLPHGQRAGVNMPEMLRSALEEVAKRHGGTDMLVIHRPGSWEAEHVVALAAMADW